MENRREFRDVPLVEAIKIGLNGVCNGLLLHSPGMAPPELERLVVDREPLLLAVPKQHPLARAVKLDVTQLMSEPLVIFPRRIAPSLHDAIFALYHAAGHTPQCVQEAVQMQTIVNLVSAGLGVAWVPASVRQFQRPGVVYREVSAAHGRRRLRVPECETSLVWSAQPTAAMSNFIALIKAQQRLDQ